MSRLPSGWAWATVEDLAAPEPRSITDGPFGSNLKTAHYTDVGPRVIRLQNIGDGVFLDEQAHISQERFSSLLSHAVRPNDLLIAGMGETLPRACLAPKSLGDAIVKADCFRVRLNAAVRPGYVCAILNSPQVRSAASQRISGVGRPRLNLKKVREIRVPVPPAAEQERIAAVIEEQFSRLDAGVKTLGSLQQKLKRMRAAVLQAAYAKHLKGSPTVLLAEVASTQLGRMLSAGRETGEHPKPYLRNRDVQWGQILTEDLPVMDFAGADAERYRLNSGDVLICEGGEIGRAAVWTAPITECYFQKALHRVRCSAELAPYFLRYLLEHYANAKAFNRFASGTTIAHLPQEDLRRLPVPMPSRAEQQETVSAIEVQLSALDHLTSGIGSLMTRASSLRATILAAAFSGELVRQDPSDEPALALLERIAAERASGSRTPPRLRQRRKATA